MSPRRLPRSGPVLGAACFAWLLGACASTTSVDEWQARNSVARSEEVRRPDDLERVDELRSSLDLEGARHLVLHLAAERPDDGEVLLRASRAESDGVLLLPRQAGDDRALAALSSLDYARRAAELLPDDAAVQAQLAWALGTTTHLQPMFSRAEHATATEAAARAALAGDPEQVTALATLATLHLRLVTLPWIARLMASGAPDGDLASAEDFARRAVALQPSTANRLLLARVLVADERSDEAQQALAEALAELPTWPRDRELRPDAEDLAARLAADG